MAPSTGGADLHLHTVYSDGTYTPETLVEQARRHALETIAVTDHDTLNGVAPVRRAAGGEPEVVAGVEFSVECGGAEVHLLGLFVDERNAALCEALGEYRRRREERARAILARLAECGVRIEEEAVLRCAGRAAPGRVHVARAMVEAGAVPNLAAAFERYLGAGRPACVPKVRHTPERTFDLIRAAGGVSVWAHPGITARDDLLAGLMDAGLQGIEVYSSGHSPADERRYLRLARRHGLLVSGGSDCHGMNKDRLLIGSVRLPDRRLEALRAAAGESTPRSEGPTRR